MEIGRFWSLSSNAGNLHIPFCSLIIIFIIWIFISYITFLVNLWVSVYETFITFRRIIVDCSWFFSMLIWSVKYLDVSGDKEEKRMINLERGESSYIEGICLDYVVCETSSLVRILSFVLKRQLISERIYLIGSRIEESGWICNRKIMSEILTRFEKVHFKQNSLMWHIHLFSI